MIAHVQQASAFEDGSDTSFAISLTGVAAGSLIVFAFKWEGADTTLAISDGTSSLVERLHVSHSNGDVHVAIFDLLAANSGNRTYTVTLGGSRPYKRGCVWEESYSESAIEYSDGSGDSGLWLGDDEETSSGDFTADGPGDHFAIGIYGEYTTRNPIGNRINDLAADDIVEVVGSFTECWRRHFSAGFIGDADLVSQGSGEWVVAGAAWKEVSSVMANDRIPPEQQEDLTDALVVSPLQVFDGQLPKQFRATSTGTDGGAGHYTTTFDPEFGG